MFDYKKLRQLIKENYETDAEFAKALGIGRVSLSQRLNNILDFDASEMQKASKLLGFDVKEIPEYFFSEKVQKHKQTG